MAQWKLIQLVSMKMWVQSLASLNGLGIPCCCELCGVGHQCGSDSAWLWLWCRSAAVAPIRPLAWNLHMPLVQPLKEKKEPS